ncbi:hypothetical protein GF412_02755 [Candidatus Micrarchaeota archaeon]|nr:hypothetical protein [Candidatus Micrarchaeota archaeon]MBD3417878.1 hypothetical protein [Candidatus Micrarchaeota archaeon]
MEDRLSAREIGAYIELKKKVAEEEYKLNYIKNTAGDHSALIGDLEESLREERAKMKIIEGKMEAKGLELVVPNQERIEEYTELISRLPREEVNHAIKNKSGDAYAYLCERGRLIKRNMENKNEIGKLNVLVANSPADVRGCVKEALRKGEPGEAEANFDQENGAKIIKLLNRVGVRCRASEGKLVKTDDGRTENRVLVNNEYFWVPSGKLDTFTENEKVLADVSIRLQVKNAEMQAITFNDEQQKEFQELQGRYMDLLKARREIIGQEEKDLTISI